MKRILFALLLVSSTAHAQLAFRGVGYKFDQALSAPSNCTGTGKPCLWYETGVGFMQHNNDGTDSPFGSGAATSVSGTATQGTFTLAPDQSGSGAGINRWLTYQPAEAGAPALNFWNGNVPNVSGADDQFFNFGWNVAAAGGSLVAGRGAVGIGMESRFVAAHVQQEFHLFSVDASDVQTRILSYENHLDDGTTALFIASTSGRIVSGHDGNGPALIVWSPGTVQAQSPSTLNGWYLDDSNAYFFSGSGSSIAKIGFIAGGFGAGHGALLTSGDLGTATDGAWDVGVDGYRYRVGRFARGVELGSTAANKPTCDSTTEGRIYVTKYVNPTATAKEICQADSAGTYAWASLAGGSGVTSIATTSPITGGTITTTGTIACATCVVTGGSTMTGPFVLSGSQTGTYTLAGTPTLGAALAIGTTATYAFGDTTHLLTKLATAKIIGGSTNTNGHTVPNVADDTFALLGAAQSFTGVKTFAAAPTWGTDNTYAFGDATHRATSLFSLAYNSGASATTLTTTVATGSSRAGFVLNDTNAATTDKVMSIQVGGVEKASFGPTGALLFATNSTGLKSSAGTGTLFVDDSVGARAQYGSTYLQAALSLVTINGNASNTNGGVALLAQTNTAVTLPASGAAIAKFSWNLTVGSTWFHMGTTNGVAGPAVDIANEVTADTGGVTAGKVTAWSGAGKCQDVTGTVGNLKTICGVAITSAAAAALAKIAKVGRVMVNADAGIVAGDLVVTSTAVAGNVMTNNAAADGARVGRATEATGTTTAGKVIIDVGAN